MALPYYEFNITKKDDGFEYEVKDKNGVGSTVKGFYSKGRLRDLEAKLKKFCHRYNTSQTIGGKQFILNTEQYAELTEKSKKRKPKKGYAWREPNYKKE